MKTILRATIVVLILLMVLPSYAQDSSAKFKVYGECAQCKHRIESALKIKGIKYASWDIPTQMLSVTYDASVIKLDDIHSKIAAVGHDTELKKAKEEVYNSLPECCHYRDMKQQSASQLKENNINGVVVSEDNKGNFIPLSGASVVWMNAQKGAGTDVHGVFSIPKETNDKLVVSYAGYRSDTLQVDGNNLQVILAVNGQLNAVTVTSRQRALYINNNSPFRVLNISPKELLKAACCNLSESFETNPSVDVSYSDAVTGSKQIQLLGLAGIYTMLTVENIPALQGLATPLGLNSIPGPWVESIQLSKGTGSVANGYQSIAGQINVELKKPESNEHLFVNGYINSMGKTDFNINLAQKVSGKWSTVLLLHDDFLHNIVDDNKDGFRDLPTGNLFSGFNRWLYEDGKGFELQFGAKALIDDKTGGENNFTDEDKLTTNYYGVQINTHRYEGFAKIGYVFPEKKYKSIGLQLSAFDHEQNSYFGLTTYNAQQHNFYSNLIFQNNISTTAHKFRTGISFSADKYNELYKTQTFTRNEVVPGAFFEYTYSPNEHFNIVAGIRGDHNNLFGWFATPRLNLRYEPVEGTTIRVSAGRGERTANIFAENMGALVSARTVIIIPSSTGKAYGLDPEIAWNKGITLDQKLKLFDRSATFMVDFYRNDFTNQVVTDMEDPRQLKFYNLNGKSYSNSLQAEIDATPAKNFDVRLAYRLFDVKTTYGNQLLQKPFTAEHRAFTNLSYDLDGWKFDYTVNYVGSKRIPSTTANPVEYQFPGHSPAYITMNAQVSKSLGKSKAFDIYVGGENLTNYFQRDAIIAATQPFGNYFDASMVWGPLSSRLMYAGFRYRISQKNR